mgnify:CR=1 FL=1
MKYKYAGYIKTLLDAPDLEIRDDLDYIEFTAEEIAGWNLIDDDADREWQVIPAEKKKSEAGVCLTGHFEGVRQIDNLTEDEPCFWVALSSRRIDDGRLPIDLNRYPMAEITYRCESLTARPSWVLGYDGGTHFDGLEPADSWQTISRMIQYNEFPRFINTISFRLYGNRRDTESMEIQSVRFRAMSDRERDASNAARTERFAGEGPPHFPLLDDFMPIGVCMKAGIAKRMAECMEMSCRDYWRLALEDVARHHHNAVALEEIGELSPSEWREILGLAESYGIRILAHHDWSEDEFREDPDRLIERDVRPYADSEALLGWAIHNEPPAHTFNMHLQAQERIRAVDPKHPLVAIMREPNSLPLFAPHFPVSGVSHFKSHVPWQLGKTIRAHVNQLGGQHLWVVAPAFVFTTETPEWNTSPEMRLMINLAFANGARGWFAFTYHNDPIWVSGNTQRSLTGPFLNFSDNWSELGHRMERFFALAPLALAAKPLESPPDCDFDITWEDHTESLRPEGVPAIQWNWLSGPDFLLLYVISNELDEVTTVHMRVPDDLPKGLEVYDMTDFVRSRNWHPSKPKRHLEMFPGQGQILLVAEHKVCEHWRDAIISRLQEDDQRQVAINLGLARRYNLDVSAIQANIRQIGTRAPIEDARVTLEAKEQLLNLLYTAPDLATAQSTLTKAGAALCACDGALCRLIGNGQTDRARDMGIRVLPLARKAAELRLRLRRGDGKTIQKDAEELSRNALALMDQIRAVR